MSKRYKVSGTGKKRRGATKRPGPFADVRTRIYVQMRAYDPHLHVVRHVPGATIVVENYTPGQIYRVITDALKAAVAAARKAQTDGKATTQAPDPYAPVFPDTNPAGGDDKPEDA